MVDCNCKWKLVDPKRHEGQCDIVLTARLHQKERTLAEVTRLIPFPGMEAFYDATVAGLQKEIDNLNRRLTRKDTPRRKR